MATISAIERGIEVTLRAYFNDTNGSRIGLAPPNMQPPPVFGQWYVGISEATASPGPAMSGDVQDEILTVQIGVTWRSSVAPMDRLGWLQANTTVQPLPIASQGVPSPPTYSIKAIADQIATLLREQYTIINNATQFIDTTNTTEQFVEPFHRVIVSQVMDKPASWVSSDADARLGEIQFITITATGARRIRTQGVVD